MGKQLLILTAACFVLSAFLIGCSTSRKVQVQNASTAKIFSNPKAGTDIYAVNLNMDAPRFQMILLKQSIYHLMPVPNIEAVETGSTEKITLVEEPMQVLVKENIPATQKTVAIKGHRHGDAGNRLNNAKPVYTEPVATQNRDAAKINVPVAAAGIPDTGNRKTDNADSKALAATSINSHTNPNEINPSPAGDNSDESAEDSKPELEDYVDPLIGKYAAMISVEPDEITNYPLYRFIDEWYGTGYKWGGEDKTGIDCSAFSQKLYGKVYGITLERTAREQRRNCERTYSDDATQGDLVFFRIHHIRVSHVGVYLANGYFVHASRSQGVVISSLNSRYWRRRFAGCGRIAKAEPTSESESAPVYP